MLAALAAVLLLTLLALIAAGPLMRLLGARVEAVITRLLGVLLAALAAQYVIDGLQGELRLSARALLQRHPVVVADRARPKNCISWTSSSQRVDKVGRLEQRLLGGGVERGDLADAVDQRGVVEPRDRIPVDAVALRVGEAARLALEPGALDRGQHLVVGSSASSSASTWRNGVVTSSSRSTRKRASPSSTML